jgi:hypothetical protein
MPKQTEEDPLDNMPEDLDELAQLVFELLLRELELERERTGKI